MRALYATNVTTRLRYECLASIRFRVCCRDETCDASNGHQLGLVAAGRQRAKSTYGSNGCVIFVQYLLVQLCEMGISCINVNLACCVISSLYTPCKIIFIDNRVVHIVYRSFIEFVSPVHLVVSM